MTATSTTSSASSTPRTCSTCFRLRGIVVLEDALYPAMFLKPDEDIASALRLLQRSRKPLALVRDDADKIVGLITLEDVLEEIVGDIEDEHDRPTAQSPLSPATGEEPSSATRSPKRKGGAGAGCQRRQPAFVGSAGGSPGSRAASASATPTRISTARLRTRLSPCQRPNAASAGPEMAGSAE